MLYSAWGGKPDSAKVSKLGFGTTRFPQSDLQDTDGIERYVELVEYAIDKGINYFDVAPPYSYGYAEKILGTAFRNNKSKPIYIAAKSGLSIDKTAEDIARRIDTSLSLLDADKIYFYHIWSVMGYDQYQTVLQKGGLYEGAMRAKEQGLIEHLCISLHCDVEDTLRIVEEGYFDGITISMNAMNYQKWLPVLKAARARNMGVATMNSLAGGMIPKYSSLFEKLDDTDDSVAVKAMRFLASFDEVDVALSGMTSKEQIDENCSAFNEDVYIRQQRNFRIETTQALCSGCNYCAPCTVGIPIADCMQAYNHKIMVESTEQSISEKTLANDIFVRTRANGVDFTKLKQCIGCRVCEKRCTQKINISGRLDEMFELAGKHCYTEQAMKKRWNDIKRLCENSKKIAVWPAADYAARTLELLSDSEFDKKLEYINTSPAMQGKKYRGKTIHLPEEIFKLQTDTILIMHYSFQDAIYEQACLLIKDHPDIRIIKLHDDNDIDWFKWYLR